MPEPGFTSEEMMTIAASRGLKNGMVCLVGVGLPSVAANLARITHAPDLVMIYEAGVIGAHPDVLPLSVGDGELSETADDVVSIPEMFRYWLQGGRIDIGFIGAAQIDRFANINTSVIGSYGRPRTRLPGSGGASEIAACAGEVHVTMRHSSRGFVGKLDFVSTLGHHKGGRSRESLRIPGRGPTRVVTDLGILEPHPETRELTLVSLHPGVELETVKGVTGWPLLVASNLTETPAPTREELEALRDLKARTDKAHSSFGGTKQTRPGETTD